MIDVHTHFLPESCLVRGEMSQTGERYLVRYTAKSSTSPIWESQGVATGFDLDQLFDSERRRRDMRLAGVETQILSVPPPFGFVYDLDAGPANYICQMLNEELSAIAESDPGHFRSLATLPLQSTKEMMAELDRSLDVLKLSGVAVGTHVGEVNLDHSDLHPLYAALEERDAPLFVHSTRALGGRRLSRNHLLNLVGNPTEDAVAVASLIFGGVLDAFPGLRVYVAHAGGSAAMLIGRWRRGWEMRPEIEHPATPPLGHLRRIWFDNLTHSSGALDYLVQTVGVEKVMLGTDYPYDMGDPNPGESLSASRSLSAMDRNRIASGTAEDFFGLQRTKDHHPVQSD